MSDHNIATSQQLLKRLEEQMDCLSGLISQMSTLMSETRTQMSSLSSQVIFVSSGIKGTWTSIKKVKDAWKRAIEKH